MPAAVRSQIADTFHTGYSLLILIAEMRGIARMTRLLRRFPDKPIGRIP
jgi:hypothetical protein